MKLATFLSTCSWLVVAMLAAGCAGASGASSTPIESPAPVQVEDTIRTAAQVPAPAPPELRLDSRATPTEYRLSLTVDPDAEGFSGVVDIDIELHQAVEHIWLNATELDVSRATMSAGGQTWPIERLSTSNQDFLGFALGTLVAPGKATLHIEYTGRVSDKEYSGIFRQKENQEYYVFTQFQAIDARRVFPCFDEPHIKVPWQISLHVPEGDLALSNAPLIGEDKSSKPGMKMYRFARSKPIPSYLVAFAVGPFDMVDLGTIGRGKTPARIFTPRGRAAETAYAASAMPRLLEMLEDYFDMPYPYEKLDSVALPRFFGAMEHPGLITYSSRILLSPPGKETWSFQRFTADIIAHELAHQWFGNLVTLAWWDDIWLNESFATWMASKMVAKWKPEWRVEMFELMSREQAMGEDSLDTARQIRQPIRSNEDIERVFDAISYSKGSVVLSMFERWIGEDAFRQGVRQYMQAHAWGATTADDFLAALSAVSRPEMPAAFRTFLDQKGLPLVSVELSCQKGQKPALGLRQERFLPAGSTGSSEQTWHIPMCVEYGSSEGGTHGMSQGNGQRAKMSGGQQCMLLTDKTATMVLEGATSCPEWVLANTASAGYYRVSYGSDMFPRLITGKSERVDGLERVGSIGDMLALARVGAIQAGEVLALVPTLAKDSDPYVSSRAATMIDELRGMVPPELEPRYRRFARAMLGMKARSLGLSGQNGQRGEPDESRMMRSMLVSTAVGVGEEPQLIQEALELADNWLETREGIDEDMLGTVLGTAVRHGGSEMYERFAKALDSTNDVRQRQSLVWALGGARGRDSLEKSFALIFSGKLDMSEAMPLFWGMGRDRETRQLAYDIIKARFDELVIKLPRRGAIYLMYMAAGFCDEEHYKDADAFFRPRLEKLGQGGTAELDQMLEGMRLCMAQRKLQRANIEVFLKKY